MRNSKAYEIVYQNIVYRDFDIIIVRGRKEESFSSDIHNNHISYNLVLMLDKKKLINKSLNLVSHHR